MSEDWIIEANDATFECAVLDRSDAVAFVVDFWAPWCAPCRTLGPQLEKLARQYQGEFILAKVNLDDNPGLGQAFRIQSIPALVGIRQRRAVAQIVGAVPEAELKRFIEQVLPSVAERLAAEAEKLAVGGRADEAERQFARALEVDGRCDAALYGMAKLLAQRGEDAAALEHLDRLLPGPLSEAADRLGAEIRLKAGAEFDEVEMRTKLDADPDDLEARFELAESLAAAGRYGDALAELLDLVRRDREFRDGAARMAMLDIFEVLGAQHPDVERYRAELGKVLFS